MTYVTRSQGDDLGDIATELSKIQRAEGAEPSPTRQEFKDESNINNILFRYGAPNAQRVGQFGVNDDRIDLTTALAALGEAKALPNAVPPELKEKYRTWRAILNATETGEYQHDLLELEKQRAAEKVKKTEEEADRQAGQNARKAAQVQQTP